MNFWKLNISIPAFALSWWLWRCRTWSWKKWGDDQKKALTYFWHNNSEICKIWRAEDWKWWLKKKSRHGASDPRGAVVWSTMMAKGLNEWVYWPIILFILSTEKWHISVMYYYKGPLFTEVWVISNDSCGLPAQSRPQNARTDYDNRTNGHTTA